MEYLLTGKAAKSVDEFCIQEIGIPSLVLMERAAYAVAKNVDEVIKIQDGSGRKTEIVIVCGIGNNGADGIAAARMLKEMGYPCRICIVGDPGKGTEELKVQYQIVNNLRIDVKVCDTKAKVDSYSFSDNNMEEVMIVDALFGIGLSRNIEGICYQMVNKINEQKSFVLSVDIASGLNSANGKVMGIAVNSDMTVTFGKMKAGHLLCDGREYSGRVQIEDVGFVKKAYNKVLDEMKDDVFVYLTKEDLKKIPKRKRTSHKGTYSNVNVIGAGAGMSGAVALAGMAAYRCGAGLVKIYAKDSNTDVIRTLVKEAVVHDYAAFDVNEKNHNKDIIVIGPGLGTVGEAKKLVENVLDTDCKIVIDADALNLISTNKILLNKFGENIVITPHLKEMSRLIEKDVSYIRENIISCAKEFSLKYGCTTVLKDATTVISSPRGNIRINRSGNSGMSKGGSGDVLSGIIAGLITQNLSVFEAASLGVYLHGLAGNLAAERNSEYSMVASDLIDAIPQVMKKYVME